MDDRRLTPLRSLWEHIDPEADNDDLLYAGWLEDYLLNEIPLCVYYFPSTLGEEEDLNSSEEDL